MEIRFFSEVYNDKYGSVFSPREPQVIKEANEMDWFMIKNPTDVFDDIADFLDDNGYRALVSSVQQASKVIIFGRDGIRPGNTANIWQVIIGDDATR